jgi:hypothetical protein
VQIVDRAEDFEGEASARFADGGNLNTFENPAREPVTEVRPSVAYRELPGAIRGEDMALVVRRVAILVLQVIGVARQATVDSIGPGKNRVVAIINFV